MAAKPNNLLFTESRNSSWQIRSLLVSVLWQNCCMVCYPAGGVLRITFPLISSNRMKVYGLELREPYVSADWRRTEGGNWKPEDDVLFIAFGYPLKLIGADYTYSLLSSKTSHHCYCSNLYPPYWPELKKIIRPFTKNKVIPARQQTGQSACRRETERSAGKDQTAGRWLFWMGKKKQSICRSSITDGESICIFTEPGEVSENVPGWRNGRDGQ